MGTVDLKNFLKEKVSSSGIINSERAVVAAELSVSSSIESAIRASRNQVRDAQALMSSAVRADKIIPVPLFPQFQ
jgi:hypothetical protein